MYLEKADQFLARASDFIHAARKLCEEGGMGHLQSACLLVGTAMELLAKKQLIEKGIDPDTLKRKPYGHDLQALWKSHTRMYDEATLINEEIRQNEKQPNSFVFAIHFDAMAFGYGKDSDFSLRYHNGERTLADACFIGRIVEHILKRERMRRQEPQ